jgi:hypothetical protein
LSLNGWYREWLTVLRIHRDLLSQINLMLAVQPRSKK